mgnify:CR=1 FL=1
MKKIIFIIFAFLCLENSFADSNKLNIFVSIMPQKYFAEQIGGEKVNVSVLVPSGTSPENFDPSPKQIIRLGSSDIYFTMGIPFEHMFLDKLSSGKNKFIVAECDKDIPKMKGHDEHNHGHDHGEFDPHIWMSPDNAKLIASNMADTLKRTDSVNAGYYEKNLEDFCMKMDKLSSDISTMLAPHKGRTFYVYHSAYTYFAERFGLIQESIETGEKEPTPAKLRDIVKDAKEENIRIILIQPEFPAVGAARVAQAIGGRVVTSSVLEFNYPENLLKTARILSDSFGEK